MSSIATAVYQSPLGTLKIGIYKEQVILCDWLHRKMRDQVDVRLCRHVNAQMSDAYHPLQKEVILQLEAYFNRQRKYFDLDLYMAGTSFQKKVWDELCKVPLGESLSYQHLYQNLGQPKAIRAIASANGANALSILVPCHRIIGKNGQLVGYAGGLTTKKKLLTIEGALPQYELF